MEQVPIGQRLKILIQALGLKVRTFAQALNVSETTVRNYLDRGSKPSSDFLESIIIHFEKTNPVFLLTGNGQPLLGIIDTGVAPFTTSTKNNSGNSIGVNHGKASQQQGTGPTSSEQVLLKEIEHLKAQLVMKDQVIASKDETIDLLKAAYGRPN
ncbi:helix-turn-helix domain-containing protein [Hymenobacter terricola]|uniref:helix-turn-helix domain-containing protein n=1 Tax=Hymenobacter terricola TaxID=2819236 RepID=UPI001B30EABB|nr:helix-turn-helix transcriptional regulator [Hymenobacter terricola]